MATCYSRPLRELDNNYAIFSLCYTSQIRNCPKHVHYPRPQWLTEFRKARIFSGLSATRASRRNPKKRDQI